MKKTDIVKLALSGWKLSDIKELVELEKTMNEIEEKEVEKDEKEDRKEDEKEEEKEDKKEEEKEDKKEEEKEDKNKTISDMMELIKKLQDDKTREKVTEDKNEEDILKDMFRDFM